MKQRVYSSYASTDHHQNSYQMEKRRPKSRIRCQVRYSLPRNAYTQLAYAVRLSDHPAWHLLTYIGTQSYRNGKIRRFGSSYSSGQAF